MALTYTLGAATFENQRLPAAGGGKTNSTSDGSIACPIKVTIPVTAISSALGNMKITLNPGVWTTLRIAPNPLPKQGFSVVLPGSVTNGDQYAMFMETGNNGQEQNNANLSCRVEIVSSSAVNLLLFMNLTMDMGSFVDGNVVQNHDRFLKSHKTAPSEYLNTVTSGYHNTGRQFSSLVTLNDGTDVVAKITSAQYTARWYHMGLPNTLGPSEVLNQYSFKMFRQGVEVFNFSVLEKTLVEFYWLPTGDYTFEPDALVYLVNLTNTNNAITYPANYGADGTPVATTLSDLPIGGLASHLLGPASAYEDRLIGLDTFKVLSFYVDTNLNPSDSQFYAVIVVTSHTPTSGSTDNTFTNSWILPNVQANGIDSPIPMPEGSIDGSVMDYNVEPATDNVISTVVDRLVCRVKVDTEQYDTAAADSLFATTWENDVNQIHIRIYDEDTNQVLHERHFFKQAGSWAGTFSGFITPIVTDLGGGIIQYDLEFHMWFLNEVGQADFANRNMRHEWTFIAEYPALQWQVQYKYEQRVEVKDFQNFDAVIDEINLFDADTGLPLQSLCQSDMVLVEVLLDMAIALDDTWNIRVYWQLEPYGYSGANERRPGGLPEEETYDSPTGMSPMGNTPVSGVPEVFDVNGRAVFFFDHTQFAVGQKVRLYVIAEPYGAPCEDPDVVTITNGLDSEDTGQFSVSMGILSLPEGFTQIEAVITGPGGGTVYIDVVEGGDYEFFYSILQTVTYTFLNANTACNWLLGTYQVSLSPCEGPAARFNANTDPVTLVSASTTTGYITVHNGSTFNVLGDGNPLTIISGLFPFAGFTPIDGCVWSSDDIGLFSGKLTYIDLAGQSLSFFDITTFDVSELKDLTLMNNALSSSNVDDIINGLNAAIVAGSLTINGGTNGPPTGASATALSNLLANGWSVTTN